MRLARAHKSQQYVNTDGNAARMPRAVTDANMM